MVGLPSPHDNYKVAVVGTKYGTKRKQDVREALQSKGHKVRSCLNLYYDPPAAPARPAVPGPTVSFQLS